MIAVKKWVFATWLVSIIVLAFADLSAIGALLRVSRECDDYRALAKRGAAVATEAAAVAEKYKAACRGK